MPKTAALRAAVFKLFTKNLMGGGVQTHPPSGARVNASKTEMIMCGDRRQLARIDRPVYVTFLGKRLECTDEVKNLGVVMDKHLTWDSHVKRLTDRCFGTLIH